MKIKDFIYYLKKLIQDGHKWQYTDINGKEKKPKFFFNGVQCFCIVLSLIALFVIKSGFNHDFAGYIIAALSLFVGLFLSLILTVFDKYQKLSADEKRSFYEETSQNQRNNFIKQFIALTSYAILISVFCIFLLGFSLLSESLNQNIFGFELVNSFKEVTLIKIIDCIEVLFIIIYRLITVYFILDFLLIVIYSLSSIYTYMDLEINHKHSR
jgi:hypothetical protein